MTAAAWFTAEERAASSALHRHRGRRRAVRDFADLAIPVLFIVVGELTARTQGAVWITAALAVVAAMEMAALPHRLVLDGLEELGPGGASSVRPAPVLRFLVSFSALSVARFAARASVAVVGLAIVRATPWWPLVLWSGVVAIGATCSGVAPLVVPSMVDGAVPVDRPDVLAHLADLADRAGVRLRSVLAAPHKTEAAADGGRLVGEGAYVVGLGRARRLVIDAALLDGPTRDLDVVAAHELGHWRLGHDRESLLFGAITAAVAAAGVWAVGQFCGVELGDPAELPLWLLTLEVIGLVGGAGLAARARRHERDADAFAAALVGPGSVADHLRRHCLASGADLEPGGWTRWTAQHPAPADRLERLVPLERR